MRVSCHGSVLGEAEDAALLEVVKRRWYTSGPACALFERRLREYTGQREVVLCNSGSSANLLALKTLAQPELGSRAIQPGDEVITAALGFPTTLSPILDIGAVPVCIDVALPGMVPTLEMVKEAYSPKTKAVVLAHTLGNNAISAALAEWCKSRGLWLVADSCDALGTPEAFDYADLSTLSFFPAHQITTGQGGAVLTRSPQLAKLTRSVRDWGRACWCQPGEDNTCGRRFGGDYDHKYTYARTGYHLAMTEFQAAIGAAQMERLPGFVTARAYNHARLNQLMTAAHQEPYFTLPPNHYASWFGYALICKSPVVRADLIAHLEAQGVQTRMVFGGNLLRQPAFKDMHIRPVGMLANTNIVHERAFWVGCWPGLGAAELEHIVNSITEYTKGLLHD